MDRIGIRRSEMKWEQKFHFDLINPVVVVIDMQNDFCHPDGAYHRNDPQTFNIDGAREIIPLLSQFLISMRQAKVTCPP